MTFWAGWRRTVSEEPDRGTPPRRGLLSRVPFADLIFPGAAITRAQIAPYAAAWLADNESDRGRDGPLWVVLGDSTAQGIGASRHDRGYVGQLRARLDEGSGTRWRVLNLSRSGDRAEDVLRNQIPVLRRLAESPRLTTCVVGANDLLRTPLERLRTELTVIMAVMPQGSVIGTVPQGIRRTRAQEVNAFITAEAARRGLRVADIWKATGPPWQGRYAEDHFHPNDHGYSFWAAALEDAIERPV